MVKFNCKKCGRLACEEDMMCSLIRDIKYGNPIEMLILSIIGFIVIYFLWNIK